MSVCHWKLPEDKQTVKKLRWTYEDNSFTEFALELLPRTKGQTKSCRIRAMDCDIHITKLIDTYPYGDNFVQEFSFYGHSSDDWEEQERLLKEYYTIPSLPQCVGSIFYTPDIGDSTFLIIQKSVKENLYCKLKVELSEQCSILESSSSLSRELTLKRKSMDSLSDVEIHCGHNVFKSHKLILATRSPVFEKMFKQSGPEDSEEVKLGKVIVQDIDAMTMSKFLEFMYEDQVSKVNPDMLEKLLKAANKFGFKSLMDSCVREMLKKLALQDCVRKLQFAKRYNIASLEAKAKVMVLNNISKFIKTTDFANLVSEFPRVFEET